MNERKDSGQPQHMYVHKDCSVHKHNIWLFKHIQKGKAVHEVYSVHSHNIFCAQRFSSFSDGHWSRPCIWYPDMSYGTIPPTEQVMVC